MLNQIVIAGRLVSDPQIIESENNIKRTYITVAVPRSYKNVDGSYDTDFIRCTLWNGIAENACEYCKKGDVVGSIDVYNNSKLINTTNLTVKSDVNKCNILELYIKNLGDILSGNISFLRSN